MENWGVVATIIGSIAAVVAVIQTARLRPRQRVAYDEVFRYHMLGDQLRLAQGGTDFKVVWGSLELKEPNVVRLVFKNRGNRPIEKSNYREPITISSPDLIGSALVDPAHSTSVILTDIDASNAGKILITPTHLAPKERFEIEIILEGKKAKYDVRGKLDEGPLRKFHFIADGLANDIRFLMTWVFGGFALMIIGAVLTSFEVRVLTQIGGIVALIGVAGFLTCFCITLVSQIRISIRKRKTSSTP